MPYIDWNIKDVAFNPLDPGPIFLFSGFVFVSNIMEKRVNEFTWHFHDMLETQWFARLFQGQLDCFTVPKLGVASCFGKIMKKYVDFHLIYRTWYYTKNYVEHVA